MKPGFVVHSPSLSQWLQSVWMSTHFGVQMPQLVGQFLSMWSALLLHSPSFAHCGHDSSRSAQMCEHTPHVCGQICGAGGAAGVSAASAASANFARVVVCAVRFS